MLHPKFFIMVEALIVGQLDILARLLLGDDDSLAVSIQTRSTRFSYSQTVDIANTLEKAFVEIFKSHSQTTIGDLNIFSRRDFDTVVRWNRSSPRSADICFHEYFDHLAQKSPHALAICSWDGDLTYSDLSLLSNKLAHYLVDLGVTTGMAVPICFDKSFMTIVAMLSIFKSGGAFVAIDPRWPSSRIQTILKAANASIVVADPSHCHLFKSFTSHVVPLASSLIHSLQQTKPFTSTESSPSMTAYIVFTSGSTGTPKGIMIDHRALCTAVMSLAAPMGISATSRVLQFAAYTFDASYGDIFITLSQGGCICIPSEHERVNDLAGVIVRLNATAACLTPSVVRVLRPEQVPCLKSLSLGGEALLPENVELWAPSVSLTNVYGPSEATIWCSSQTKLKVYSQANNIGLGLEALMWIASITNHNILSPIGCIGELLIEGPVLAQGYLDAEQTKRAFIENPRWAEVKPGETRRFYKTGDLVKYDVDGTISFIGRKDTQIKVHGHRIEMGEIEYHLSKHDILRQSMIAYPSTGVHKHKLVAVVVLKTNPRSTENEGIKLLPDSEKHAASLEVSKIKRFLASKVPHYMIPPSWIVVEDIPLISSGKMNRVLVKAFLENVAEGHIHQNIKTATATVNHDQNTRAEMRLQNIWSQVLDKKTVDVGIDQTFVALGGDSLAAMDLVARCKAEGLSIEMQDILAGTTIRQLAISFEVVLSGAAIKELTKTDMKTGSRAIGRTHLQMQRKLLPAWWDT
jgi:amino acid adenylation domain-containing protein